MDNIGVFVILAATTTLNCCHGDSKMSWLVVSFNLVTSIRTFSSA